MRQQIQVEFNVPAAMRDGTALRANVFRPVANGPCPVVLCRTPYNKDLASVNPILDAVRLTRAGFIVVIQDVRGRGTSDGSWIPFMNEAQDGYDSVEWAAQLPGSNGNVGMYGASYVGFTQWVAAAQAPPHLKAIMPAVTWADAGDGLLWRGGAFELGLVVYLLTYGFGFDSVLRQNLKAPPSARMEAIRALAAHINGLPAGGYLSLPQNNFEILKMLDFGNDWLNALIHPKSPTYCSPFASSENYRLFQVPAYNIGGWYDIFAQGTLRNFSFLSSDCSITPARQSKLLMGPWSHVNFDHVIGEQDFGVQTSLASINMETDLTGLAQRWFDYWLKGLDNGMMDEPPVKLLIMGENVWREEQEWPLARTEYIPFYLRSRGLLTPEPPGEEIPDDYVYDPAHPTPTAGGAIHMHPAYGAGVKDQRSIEARPDGLVYTSEPLMQEMEVTGPIIVQLWASSDAPDTDFVARLVDVHPDGFSQNLTDGVIRARYRGGNTPILLKPGQPYEFTIDLWATAIVFKVGHCIRLQVTSACFPRWDRNPNTGEPFGEETFARTARQTILHDANHPSNIVLPIIPH